MRPFVRLTRRAQFLQAGRGRKQNGRHMVIQIHKRPTDADGPARFGFTITKKAGNAVLRNRIRRRLREVVRLNAPLYARPGHDYVLIGRQSAVKAPFESLVAELLLAFDTGGSASASRAKPGPSKHD